MKYYTSTGWRIDLRKLHSDDSGYIRECEDEMERQIFIDQCHIDYWKKGKDILAKSERELLDRITKGI